MSRTKIEISGLNELSMNIATAIAMKTKDRPGCVKMNLLPSAKSRESPRTVLSAS